MIRENTIFYLEQAKSTDVLMSHMGKGHKLLSEKSMNKNSLHNWSEYLERISKNKDAIAFRHLFEHFAPRVKSFLMKSGGSENQAEESMQEAMATVWQKASMFDSQKASASTWIFTIARNKKLDAIRKINRPEPEELPWMETEQSDARDAIIIQEEQINLALAVSWSIPIGF